MAGRFEKNPFQEEQEEEVNPFSDPAVRGKASGQSNYGGGSFFTTNPGNSRLSPLPPEPAGFNFGHDATIDIPIDTTTGGRNSKDLQRKERELQTKEAELRRREQWLRAFDLSGVLKIYRVWE
uniref:Uncharacterized protein n=1 Tax=Quercus lobata TaxID=97700 RepID=A0A7N2LQF4_QUELO